MVSITGIYCLPSCRARKPKPENVVFHDSPESAQQAVRADLHAGREVPGRCGPRQYRLAPHECRRRGRVGRLACRGGPQRHGVHRCGRGGTESGRRDRPDAKQRASVSHFVPCRPGTFRSGTRGSRTHDPSPCQRCSLNTPAALYDRP
ncbi:Ada metal-binding domain-containing protein [Deinococcus aquiradiocola]|uniref:Ada metal-binding domain-containing protein n=1 Tax=Deinococcus aquiradiocola TaxID=393059 RepID=UPI0016656D7F|nr:Ada metal-binding domain-containing protein [Deinococcus aquiradiocola]